MKYFALLAVLMLTQCDDDEHFGCTEEFIYGLNITIIDASNSAVLTENITVIARDGDYEETLTFIDGLTSFFGAGERPGNYIIEVMADGYSDFTSELIVLDSDICHVIPQNLEFELEPN